MCVCVYVVSVVRTLWDKIPTKKKTSIPVNVVYVGTFLLVLMIKHIINNLLNISRIIFFWKSKMHKTFVWSARDRVKVKGLENTVCTVFKRPLFYGMSPKTWKPKVVVCMRVCDIRGICIMTWVWHRYYKEKVITHVPIFSKGLQIIQKEFPVSFLFLL